jgi:putative PIN family toxin of toxin-antitoxin system
MLRVVLDTNILVSAIIFGGKSRKLLKKGITKRYSIVISDLILRELVTVLRRPKFRTNEDEVHRTILALIRTADVVNVKAKTNVVKEDPKDNMIIETAIDGEADLIVTGDRHLLELESYRGIRIVTAQEMFAILKKQQ